MLEYLYGKMFGSKIAWSNRKECDRVGEGPNTKTGCGGWRPTWILLILQNEKPHYFLKKSTVIEYICKQLRPAGSRPPRLYGLLKIYKEAVPLRPIVSNIGALTYQLSRYLGLLSQLTGNSAHHVKNSFQFIQIL